MVRMHYAVKGSNQTAAPSELPQFIYDELFVKQKITLTFTSL